MRLIDLQPAKQDLPPAIAISVGDVLKFAASGGHVRGGEAVELLGVFSAAAVGTDGSLLTPAGPPGVVLFLASRPGTATVDVVSGDPFHTPHPITLEVSVQP